MRTEIEERYNKLNSKKENIKHNLKGFLDSGQYNSLNVGIDIVENLDMAIYVLGELLESIEEFLERLQSQEYPEEVSRNVMKMQYRMALEKASRISEGMLRENTINVIFTSFNNYKNKY